MPVHIQDYENIEEALGEFNMPNLYVDILYGKGVQHYNFLKEDFIKLYENKEKLRNDYFKFSRKIERDMDFVSFFIKEIETWRELQLLKDKKNSPEEFKRLNNCRKKMERAGKRRIFYSPQLNDGEGN